MKLFISVMILIAWATIIMTMLWALYQAVRYYAKGIVNVARDEKGTFWVHVGSSALFILLLVPLIITGPESIASTTLIATIVADGTVFFTTIIVILKS